MMRDIRIVQVHPAEPIDQRILGKQDSRSPSSSFGSNTLPPTWAKVVEISGPNHVDVELVNGLILKYVPIRSQEWVKKVDTTHATGHKDIPPVGSKALLIFPDGIIENALVLCSGFDPLVQAQKDTLLKDADTGKDMSIDEYGWAYVKDKDTGKITFISPDNSSNTKVSITVDPEGKSVVIEQKLSASPTDKNTIDMSASGIKFNGGNFEVLI
jgi:hypothetical protein